jgi:DhnA family fructose-bisphosphate aldolase class Ia
MPYSIGEYKYSTASFLPEKLFWSLTDLRVKGIADILSSEAEARQRRQSLTTDGKLTILAADHPGRMVTNVGDNPIAMGDRYEYLGRVLRVITDPTFDGLMATPDIIEDVFLVNYLYKQKGGKSFLDNKVLLGSMNRGGLAGTVWEMDDRYTSYTPQGIADLRLDGGKVMFRLDVNDSGSGATIDYTAQVINEMADMGLPIFVEALMMEKTADGKLRNKKEATASIKAVSVGASLGTTTAFTWLKIAYCDNYASVARSTTIPILMLGGEAKTDPTPMITEFVNGMAVGGSVRGALVGRNILYPGKDDPLAVALAVNGIVHQGYTVDQALECVAKNRDKNVGIFKKWAK